nr:uncharacterized protein LOC127310817 [Lolium perenne]
MASTMSIPRQMDMGDRSVYLRSVLHHDAYLPAHLSPRAPPPATCASPDLPRCRQPPPGAPAPAPPPAPSPAAPDAPSPAAPPRATLLPSPSPLPPSSGAPPEPELHPAGHLVPPPEPELHPAGHPSPSSPHIGAAPPASSLLTRQQWYNQKHTFIGHFKAEQGTRVKKADNIRDDTQLTRDDYMKVMPLWCENKEDAFEALVARWVSEDADFNAKSARNKANRGTGGTHSAGSRITERYRKHKEAELGEPLTEVGGWQKMKLKQPDLSQPQPSLPEYFGYAEEELANYC